MQVINRICFNTCFKGKTAVDYITDVEPLVTDSVSTENIQTQESKHESTTVERNKKTEKSDWREKYYNSILETDEKKIGSEVLMTKLKSYNLLLKNIELENKMGKFLILSPSFYIFTGT